MLVIKDKQIRSFEMVRLPSFEETMIKHIEAHFRPLAIAIGREGLTNLIRHGYERCKKYGFTTSYEVCLFIDLMILMGCGFDTDPQYSWADQHLVYGVTEDPTQRIDILYESALDFSGRVLHYDDVFPVSAFRRLFDYPLENLDKFSTESLLKDLPPVFEQLWEHKYNNVDEERLQLLIKRGIWKARKYGFGSDRGIGYYILLTFFFGHNFDTDPQYPWISECLKNNELDDDERVKQLQSKVNSNVLSDIYRLIIQ